jgi:MYXO-CTERM domain-containing protein
MGPAGFGHTVAIDGELGVAAWVLKTGEVAVWPFAPKLLGSYAPRKLVLPGLAVDVAVGLMNGEVGLAWTTIENDESSVRFTTFSLLRDEDRTEGLKPLVLEPNPPDDGGVVLDAGLADAGTIVDAGVAGADGGSSAQPLAYVTVCGCSASSAPFWLVFVLAGSPAWRRRRIQR